MLQDQAPPHQPALSTGIQEPEPRPRPPRLHAPKPPGAWQPRDPLQTPERSLQQMPLSFPVPAGLAAGACRGCLRPRRPLLQPFPLPAARAAGGLGVSVSNLPGPGGLQPGPSSSRSLRGSGIRGGRGARGHLPARSSGVAVSCAAAPHLRPQVPRPPRSRVGAALFRVGEVGRGRGGGVGAGVGPRAGERRPGTRRLFVCLCVCGPGLPP